MPSTVNYGAPGSITAAPLFPSKIFPNQHHGAVGDTAIGLSSAWSARVRKPECVAVDLKYPTGAEPLHLAHSNQVQRQATLDLLAWQFPDLHHRRGQQISVTRRFTDGSTVRSGSDL